MTSAQTDSVDLKYYIPDPLIKYVRQPLHQRPSVNTRLTVSDHIYYLAAILYVVD